IRLLIRRPECLGPALRGEGEGLLRAIITGNDLSDRIYQKRFQLSATEDFSHPMPSNEEDDDWIDTGAAILA
ncbi:hypothetical protein, partial [Gelidibacter salicanalis]|uniref:hypothetical protein n=1 Tax=Gelidibacter salicanalis TaxID=291193 RepID=UPI001F1DE016